MYQVYELKFGRIFSFMVQILITQTLIREFKREISCVRYYKVFTFTIFILMNNFYTAYTINVNFMVTY